jgi:hypothetical protein
MLIVVSDTVLLAQIFAPRVDYRVGLRPYSIVSVDVDRDGDYDLVTASNIAYESDGKGWVFILKNNGDGIFALSDSIAVGDGPTLAAADLNNNGTVDLVDADFYTNRIYVLMNDGNGSFAVADSFASGGQGSSELCTSDLDGDGDVDLAVPNTGSNTLSIFFNNGNAAFTGPVIYPMGNYPLVAISADLDRDGDSDLVVTNNNSGTVCIMLNDSSGGFPSRTLYPVRNNAYKPALADFNGDGHLDLAVPNAGPATPFVSILMGNGDGTFAPRVDLAGCRPHDVAPGDYDLDGDIDMAVSNNECNSVSIFLNNGNGTFAPHFTLPAGIGTTHIVARDFDGDGDLDLAVENYDHDGVPGNSISVFMNQTITSVPGGSPVPNAFSLDQNYPNPFNPSTSIVYSVPATGYVSLTVFNMLGKEVATLVSQVQRPGNHRVMWNANGISSGVYFCRLAAGSFIETRKLVLVR